MAEGPQELREAYERSQARIAELEGTVEELSGQLRPLRIERAGFPEGSPGYKHLTNFYDGDVNDVEAMTTFAAEYGFEPGQAPRRTDTPDPVADADAKAGQLRTNSQPLEPETEEQALHQEIVKAESEGRWSDAINLKRQMTPAPQQQ